MCSGFSNICPKSIFCSCLWHFYFWFALMSWLKLALLPMWQPLRFKFLCPVLIKQTFITLCHILESHSAALHKNTYSFNHILSAYMKGNWDGWTHHTKLPLVVIQNTLRNSKIIHPCYQPLEKWIWYWGKKTNSVLHILYFLFSPG